MQLLRDNLTLWTSSDGAETEAEPKTEQAAEATTEAAPEAEKPTA